MEEILSKLNEIQNQLDDLEGKMVEVHGYLWGSEGLLGSIYGKTTLRARIGKQMEEIINNWKGA